jgi:hypothetical protein
MVIDPGKYAAFGMGFFLYDVVTLRNLSIVYGLMVISNKLSELGI